MHVENIDHKNWKSFFDSFNKKHKQWIFDLEQIENKNEKNRIEKNIKLKEVAVDIEAGENNNTVMISGNKNDEEINHTVLRVSSISLKKNDEGGDGALYLGSEEGMIVVLNFRSSPPVHRVDGIV